MRDKNFNRSFGDIAMDKYNDPMKLLSFLTILFLLSCSSNHSGEGPAPKLVIQEKEPDRETAIAKQNLLQLTQVYDIESLLYNRHVIVQRKKAHNAPEVTISSQYAHVPNNLLSHLLHEEFHWWLNHQPKTTSKKSSFSQEVLVCDLEYEALVKFLGKSEGDKLIKLKILTMSSLAPSYSEALKKQKIIHSYLIKKNLLPVILK